MVTAAGIRRGREAGKTLERLFETAVSRPQILPAQYWSVRPAASHDGQEQVRITGVVLITVHGRRTVAEDLPAELTLALAEQPPHPGIELWKLLRADGALAPLALFAALAIAGGAVLLESLLFRGMFDLGRELGVSGQRLGAVAGILVFLAALFALEFPITVAALGIGRRLEVRLRLKFLSKIPRLGDRYFQRYRRGSSAREAIFTRKVGHTQRGGRPILFDRFYAAQLGAKAIDMLLEGRNNAVAILQHTEAKGFYVEDYDANRFRDRWGHIHARTMHADLYDPVLMKPSKLGVDYLLPIFTDAIGNDDAEHMRQTLFDPGNLAQPYHSINTDVHKRIRYLAQDQSGD